jgi:ABC-2 type transport system ATP-binding protein
LIRVDQLTKVYRVPVREPGLWPAIRSLWDRRWKEVRAVDRVTFRVEDGERVGFLGPNGAGKTTTLKMLTGLLHPTAGSCEVAGHRPAARERVFLQAITLVMGQKQQLLWDLPPSETFALNRALFDIDRAVFRETVEELVALLDLAGFLDQPVRNLSLGQRMRCELAAALLHRPRILFLDEPTIGLDVEGTLQVRRFIRDYNQRTGATVVLTSHDMQDVGAIVDRLVLIDRGVIRFDASLEQFRREFGSGRLLTARVPEQVDLTGVGLVREAGAWTGTFPAGEVNGRLAEVLRRAPDAEVTVADPPLEEVLARAFGANRAEKAS